jgi:hypothetical protein
MNVASRVFEAMANHLVEMAQKTTMPPPTKDY